MRIDDNLAASSDLQSSQVAKTQQLRVEQESKPKPAESGKDTVSLSPLGSDLAQAINNDSPETIRQIDQLQQAVNNGTFNVPPDQVARSVVTAALNGE